MEGRGGNTREKKSIDESYLDRRRLAPGPLESVSAPVRLWGRCVGFLFQDPGSTTRKERPLRHGVDVSIFSFVPMTPSLQGELFLLLVS